MTCLTIRKKDIVHPIILAWVKQKGISPNTPIRLRKTGQCSTFRALSDYETAKVYCYQVFDKDNGRSTARFSGDGYNHFTQNNNVINDRKKAFVDKSPNAVFCSVEYTVPENPRYYIYAAENAFDILNPHKDAKDELDNLSLWALVVYKQCNSMGRKDEFRRISSDSLSIAQDRLQECGFIKLGKPNKRTGVKSVRITDKGRARAEQEKDVFELRCQLKKDGIIRSIY